ncbi:MAG TPA: VWA domain-containing protein [Planctomycetota bacterium]|nr:VWA domain-containing protein [Planctomycetota bacterium]
MLLQLNGKVTATALSTLLLGSGFGLFPVGRFVAPRAPEPEPGPKPIHVPFGPLGSNSTAHTKVGPLSVDALLSQSRVCLAEDGTLYVDVKIKADESTAELERRPIDFALVLDVSGSMADDNKIGLMKQACLGLGEQLGSKDRIALVSFSTMAQTLLPLGKIDNAEFDRAVRALVAQGGTNISDGIALGAAELRKNAREGAARRILLLTDGQPNQGDATPEGLSRLCGKLYHDGVSVTTVGLGLDVNGRLLSDMAESGGGTYHFVDDPQRIRGIYDAELRSLRSLVASGVKVTIEGVGAELQDVIEWTPERSGNKVTINVGDLDSGRSTKVVARLRVKTGRDKPIADLVRVSVSCTDARVRQEISPQTVALGVTFTDDLAQARSSTIQAAQPDLESAQVGELIETARASAERGDRARMHAALAELQAKRKTLEYTARDGKVMKMDTVQLGAALESNSFEERARGSLFSRSAASAECK